MSTSTTKPSPAAATVSAASASACSSAPSTTLSPSLALLLCPRHSKVAPEDAPLLEEQVAKENAAFHEDADFDRESRERFKADMARPQTYTAEEDAIVDEGLGLFAKKERGDLNMEPVKVKSPLLKDACAFVQREDDDVHGCVRCVARGASVEDIIAYTFDWESRWFIDYERNPDVIDKKTLLVENAHNSVIYYRVIAPRPMRDRDFEVRMVWKRLSSTQCIMVLSPSSSKPHLPGIVRAHNTRAMRLTQIDSDTVSYELVFSINMMGLIPRAVTRTVALPASISGLSRVQLYFIFLKNVEDFDEEGEDASMLAQLLMDSVRFAKRGADISFRDAKRRALLLYFSRSAALRQLSLRYPWLAVLMWSIVKSKLRPPSSCSTPLYSLTAAEAKNVGASVASILMSSTNATGAVDEFILAFPAMQELSAAVPIFRPFVVCIAKCLFESSTWGTKTRLLVGALLSIIDMITDINMIVNYFKSGETSAAQTLLVVIMMNFLWQFVIVVYQHWRKPRGVIVREVLVVLSCLKPGVDAYRVIAGGEKDPLLRFDPLLEMVFSKATELAFEAIPGGLFQTVILISTPKKTAVALFSITASALSAAYTAATMAFDLDTSPEKRQFLPKLFGFVPDQGRGTVFFLMVLLALCQTVAKVFSVALLAATNSVWLMIWLSVDYGFFLMYKIVRRDFVYFVPGLGGVVKYLVALIVRIVSKLLTDATGLLITRNPYELGARYYSFNIFASQTSCWLAAGLYVNYFYVKGKIDSTTVYLFIGILQSLWLISMFLFFAKIKRRYWITFYSSQSGRQLTMSYFTENRDDATRVKVFEDNEDLWSDIKDDVKNFMYNNWLRWEKEKPSWFNENFKALVPDEYIPKASLDELNNNQGGKRLRSSFAGFLLDPNASAAGTS